jgi:hypothetical protein
MSTMSRIDRQKWNNSSTRDGRWTTHFAESLWKM